MLLLIDSELFHVYKGPRSNKVLGTFGLCWKYQGAHSGLLHFRLVRKKNQSKEGLEQSHFVLQFFSFLSICTCFVSFLVRCSSLIPFCFRLFIMLKVMMTIRDAYLLSGYCYFVLKRLLVRVSTVVMPCSAQFKIRIHLPTDNLYSNKFLNKTSSNSFGPFKDCKNPIFKVKFLCEKSAESF